MNKQKSRKYEKRVNCWSLRYSDFKPMSFISYHVAFFMVTNSHVADLFDLCCSDICGANLIFLIYFKDEFCLILFHSEFTDVGKNHTKFDYQSLKRKNDRLLMCLPTLFL